MTGVSRSFTNAGHYGAKCRADHYTDCEIDDITAEDEFVEILFERASSPLSTRPVGVVMAFNSNRQPRCVSSRVVYCANSGLKIMPPGRPYHSSSPLAVHAYQQTHETHGRG